MLKKFIGDKAFYRRIMALSLPIMVQNGITNFVNMLDNIMVGKVGTVEMTGVAVTNQLIFIFNLCIFGALSGAGIFGAQFYGNGNSEGVRHTFRFKIIFCTLLTVAAIAVLKLNCESLINLYLTGDGDAESINGSLSAAKDYLAVIVIGLVPYTLTQCYSSTLRETGHAVLPMTAGIISVSVNLVLNYILIFGHFGAPVLGVRGAAIATVISRFVELLIVAVVTGIKKRENEFIIGAFRSFYVPRALVLQIFAKGIPLMFNETLWAAGKAILNQRYSTVSYNVVSANNICQTFSDVFAVAFISVGAAIGIIIGQQLGAGQTEQAKRDSVKLIAFSVALCCAISVIYFAVAVFIPNVYNTEPAVRSLATSLMRIYALTMPFDAFANATYFTLRSGGKVFLTMLFDSIFVIAVPVPVAILLTTVFHMPILPLFAICQTLNLFKAVLGCIFVNKGVWIKNIVAEI